MSNPYAADLGSRDPQQVMLDTPARLNAIYCSLTPEQLEAAPAPGKWSPREVLCHLTDCEIAFAWRLRIAFEKTHAVLQPFDQDPWARIYRAYTVPQARNAFAGLRAWNNAFIAALTEVDKQKPVTHPERGEMTLWTIVETIAGHDLHHLAALGKLHPTA
jgi:uncharacterized damage-inducible protein DinB